MDAFHQFGWFNEIQSLDGEFVAFFVSFASLKPHFPEGWCLLRKSLGTILKLGGTIFLIVNGASQL